MNDQNHNNSEERKKVSDETNLSFIIIIFY